MKNKISNIILYKPGTFIDIYILIYKSGREVAENYLSFSGSEEDLDSPCMRLCKDIEMASQNK